MSGRLYSRLSVMMFFQYAIWGAWLPILYPYLMSKRFGWDAAEVGYIFAVGAAGAILGPFLAGQAADRHLSTEKVLGVCHLLGAALMLALTQTTSYWGWFGVSLLYGVVYAPTLALTNSLAFHHMPDRDRDFGRVRVWGTIGWIAVGIAVGHWLLRVHTPEGTQALEAAASALGVEAMPTAATADQLDAWVKTVKTAAQNAGRVDAFYLAMALGAVMGIFCFLFLPRTPPSRKTEDNATFKAMGSVAMQPLAMLFALSLVVSIVHQFYFVYTADYLTGLQNKAAGAKGAADVINKVLGVGGGGLMTVGQMSEILVLALLVPFLAKATSRKTLLGVGLVAYALRMAIFAYFDNIWIATIGVALHGLCFGCFIFVAFMIVDEETTDDVRASAQNLYNFVIIGVGVGLGSIISGYIGKWATHPTGEVNEAGEAISALNYTQLFTAPMFAALVCLAALLVFYPGGKRRPVEPSTP